MERTEEGQKVLSTIRVAVSNDALTHSYLAFQPFVRLLLDVHTLSFFRTRPHVAREHSKNIRDDRSATQPKNVLITCQLVKLVKTLRDTMFYSYAKYQWRTKSVSLNIRVR